MFDRFTDKSRKTMALARREALSLKHDFIGTAHILAGLVREETGVAGSVLADLGVGLEGLRSQIRNRTDSQPPADNSGPLPFTENAKIALAAALEEAVNLGHDYIATEHLLLGLIGDSPGLAGEILADEGVDLGDVRAKVLDRLQPRAPQKRPTPRCRHCDLPMTTEGYLDVSTDRRSMKIAWTDGLLFAAPGIARRRVDGGKPAFYPVSAYRCSECGALELYAFEE